jgi:uncharacterized protein YbaR (Trm112 family)/SAM-dependent methyltransferase
MENNKKSFKLKRRLISCLACPICKNKLFLNNNFIECNKCHKEYPIINEIPILINEINSLFEITDFIKYKNTTREFGEHNKNKLIKKIYKKFIPKIDANLRAKQNYKILSKLLSKKKRPRILVIGGGEIGKGMESFLDNKDFEIIEGDVYFGERTQIIFDGHDIPFASETFDAVIIQAVLEHVLDPYKVVQEIHRVLKKEGIVYAETPFMQQVHENEFDFTRFTLGGHRRLFRYFKEVSSGMVCGPGMALAWSIDRFFDSFSKSKAMVLFRKGILPFFIFWLKYFDYYFLKKPGASDNASGVYFMGTKSNKPISDKEIIKNYWRNRLSN